MKKIIKLKTIFCLSLFLLLFFKYLNKENLKLPYHKLKDFLISKEMIFFNKKSYNNQLKKYDCLPELLEEIPYNSTIIIGHAYGRLNSRSLSSSISPYIENFIKKKKNKIKTIFFTGDVFNIPNRKKWQQLYNSYQNDIEIFIVPGNHDVGNNNNNSRRKIFNIEVAKHQSIKFPYMVKRSGFNIILDDSTVGNSLFDFEDNFLEEVSRENKKLLVLRHHILINELQKNSGGTPIYYEILDIKNKFKSFANVSFISGNGGMRKSNDRISCFKHDKFTHILNGIGDIKSDNILVLFNGAIYRYEINNL